MIRSGTHRLLAALLALLAGCVEKADHVRPVDRQAVKRWVSEEPKKPQHPLRARLGDVVELTGYDLSPATIEAGEPFTITWHWKVLKAPGPGWLQFTHVSDARGKSRLNQDTAGMVRRAYPAGQWRAGEYIRDAQPMELPEDWASPKVTFHLGLWKGNERLPVTVGAHDDERRLRALTLPVKDAAPPAPPPELKVVRADEPPTLDGKLDEAVWKKAANTGKFVNTLTGAKAEPRTELRAAWDDAALYLAFEVEDDYLRSEYAKHDDHLWEQDCVEMMFDPDGDARNYFELQVSPQGVVFDTRYDSRRRPGPIGHADWDSGLKSAVALRGKLNDEDEDQGYTVEIAIPWTAFDAGKPPAKKPGEGDRWRANFYVMDAREKGQRAAGWSPPRVRDFHVPDRFGTLVFE